MKAGAAQIDLKPIPGHAVLGQLLRRTAVLVHDPLYASALALESRDEAILFIACDLLVLDNPLIDAVRERVSAATGLAPERVWVSATHTHTGPAVMGTGGTNVDAEFRARFPEMAARAAIQAWEHREDAVCGMADGTAPGWTFPRRYWMRDGQVRMHPPKGSPEIIAPEGAADSSLSVLWARAVSDNRLIGTLVNFGSHAIVVGSESLYSADFPGALRARIQRDAGKDAVVLFGNGPCGDTCPFEVERPDKHEQGFEWVERMGNALGEKALALMAGGKSEPDPILRCARTLIELPARSPEPEAVAAAQAVMAGRSLEAEPADVDTMWARELLLYAREYQPTRRLEVAAARIGDGVLASIPGELFASLWQRIKENSSLQPVLVIELCNGYGGYLPTPEAFAAGGYEVRLARTSMLAPEAGTRLAAAALEQIRAVAVEKSDKTSD